MIHSANRPNEFSTLSVNPPRSGDSWRALVLLSTCMLWSASALLAAEPNDDATAREQSALQFAEQHHPELARLLEPLRRMNPKEYREAMRDLTRTAERLEKLQERQPERYEFELQLWKLNSRIRLHVAQAQGPDDDAARQQLSAWIAERNRIQAAWLVQERDKLRARLGKVDEELEKLQSDSPATADAEARRLLQSSRPRPVANPLKKSTPAAPPGEASPLKKRVQEPST